MRLQHSRSSALIAIAGKTQAMIGTAKSSSDKSETPSLTTDLIASQKYRFNGRLDAMQPGELQFTGGSKNSCQLFWLPASGERFGDAKQCRIALSIGAQRDDLQFGTDM